MIDLGIVIVNYNVRDLLRRCLQSVFAAQGDLAVDVWVVDNASPDDSVAMVRREFPRVHVIANAENAGYPAANNQALRAMGVGVESGGNRPVPPRYSLLLNPDTEVEPDTFTGLVTYMDTHPDVGVVGPKLLLPSGELDHACRRGFPAPWPSFYYMLGLSKLFPNSSRFGQYDMGYLDLNEIADVDSVTGAFMLVRTEAIEKVGLLDEQFWMYGEDLDWAKRIKDAGWRVVYNPTVEALHVKGVSSRQNPRARREFYRAMPIFYYKHYRDDTPLWLHLLVMLGLAIRGGRPLWRELLAGRAILQK